MTQGATRSTHPEHHPIRRRPTAPVGLYDPAFEHDSCGVAFVARLNGIPSHETIERAMVALGNLEHRGAAGADPLTGDGAGILLQLPHEFFRAVIREELPPPGAYGVAVCFLPRDDEARRAELERLLERAVADEGQRVVCWRDVPVDLAHVGATAREVAPSVRQLVVAASPELAADRDAFERKLYVIRRIAEIAAGPELVLPSFSARTIVYKGMLMAPQLPGCYPDLRDERLKSALVLIHSRFSTNTFPSWELAHPYRLIAHNGEINTVRGNVNWMRARESQLASELFGDDLRKVLPVVRPGGSDTANFDNVLELLLLAGRSLPHAMMMMIPEAYDGRDDLPEALKGFYAFHGCLTEPWDGPASICFTDGTVIGATLDRNGLRPGRWLETQDGWVILASETGVIEEEPANILRKGRLQPGKIFLVDLEQGRIVEDEEVKRTVATRRPYGEWFDRGVVRLADLPDRTPRVPREEPLRARQLAFGYTQEDLKVILAPLARNAEEAIGSMGNDLALAVLSEQRPLLYSYFKQLFAQVTNPPIDSTREAVVMSVATSVGSERNLLGESPEHARQLLIDQPILRSSELESLRQVESSAFKARTIDITWPVAEGPAGMATALARICARGRRRARRRRQHRHPLGSQPGRRARPDPGAARRLVGPPPPRPRGDASAGGPRDRVRRAARGAPLRDADRLRRRRDQPVRDARDARRAGGRGLASGRDVRRAGAGPGDQGDRQGAAEDDLEDGDLDDLRPTAARRSSRRSASSRSWSTATSSAPPRASPASGSRCWRARRSTGTPAPIPDRTAACCRSAASTPGGGTASTTCGTRRRSPCSSTRCGTAAMRPTSSTRSS